MKVFCNQLSQSRVSPQGPTLEFHPKVPPQSPTLTVQKMKFFTMDFFSKCKQIRQKVRIWSHLPKKSLMDNFIFCAVSRPNPGSHSRVPIQGLTPVSHPRVSPQEPTPCIIAGPHPKFPPQALTQGSWVRSLTPGFWSHFLLFFQILLPPKVSFRSSDNIIFNESFIPVGGNLCSVQQKQYALFQRPFSAVGNHN